MSLFLLPFHGRVGLEMTGFGTGCKLLLFFAFQFKVFGGGRQKLCVKTALTSSTRQQVLIHVIIRNPIMAAPNLGTESVVADTGPRVADEWN